MIHLLFFARLALYLLIAALPALHPAIAVPYDRVSLTAWFVLVPVEMLIAFYLSPPRLRLGRWLAAAAAPVVLFVLVLAGFELATLLYVAIAVLAFALTALAFRTGGRSPALAAVEPFLLALLAYRLLSFSRASEAIARQASGITQTLLVLLPCAFLLHAAVLYLAAFRQSRAGDRRGLRELGLFLLIALPAFLALSFLLPPDFVRNSVVLNRPDRDIKPKRVPLDEEGRGLEQGNLRSPNGRLEEGLEEEGEGGQGEEEGEDGRNSLEGLPADQWGDASLGEGGESKQYAVMVVASPVEPVYAADTYAGLFDPERGFLRSRDEPLNELSYLRFLETWRDPAPEADLMRAPYETFFLSTLPGRYLAYRPFTIEPTVLKREYYPFEYSYRAVSRISSSAPADWRAIGGLGSEELAGRQGYLELGLPPEALARLKEHLSRVLSPEAGYSERIEAILKSFSTYQYQLGFTEDTSVERILDFLFRDKRGDCTEFSHSAALLLRLAGVPSRVVTGYLASSELQTFAHRRAIYVLRRALPALQEFPPNELYLVTTAQRHSWVQAYLPGFGWVDFESTAFAIPPPPGENPGDLDVVIPLIQPLPQEMPAFRFPWVPALQALGALAILALLGLYLFRYLREAALALLARGENPRALRALYLLLLLKLCSRGYTPKRPSQTAAEYAERYPELADFAAPYTRLRYRERMNDEEKARLWRELRAAYAEILRGSRKPGLWSGVRRAFSLRGVLSL